VSPSGETTVWHEGPFHFTNGLALSPSQDALFVVCTYASTVERIDIEPHGAAGKRSTYLTLEGTLPDGLAFSAQGEMFVSCYTPSRIYRVIPGSPPTAVVYADDWTDHLLCHPTNICFGGADGATLFAANLGRWHIASIASGR
jgi:sugar lactone lactonase YvrE